MRWVRGHRLQSGDSHGAREPLSLRAVAFALLIVFLSVAWFELPAKGHRVTPTAKSPIGVAVAPSSPGGEAPATVLSATGRTPDPATLLREPPLGRAQSHLRAQPIAAPLHTSGRQILDARNRPIRLNSINISSLGPGAGLPGPQGQAATGCWGWQAPTQQVYDNVRAWGFNSVRLSISWANLEPSPPTRGPGGAPQHHYNAAYLAAVDAAVKGFTDRGIAVILVTMQSQWSPAFHNIPTAFGVTCQGVGMPTWLYPHASPAGLTQARRSFFANTGEVQQGYVAAWQFLVRRYAADRLMVGADMFNEPYTLGKFASADLHLGPLYVRLGKAIRAINNRLLLIFEDSNFPGNGPMALSAPPPFPNVVYSFHMYQKQWVPRGLQTVRVYASRALRWNVPVWIGEFDAFGYTTSRQVRPSSPNWRPDLVRMLTDCRAWNIGWAVWTYAKGFMAPDGQQPKAGLLQALRTGF